MVKDHKRHAPRDEIWVRRAAGPEEASRHASALAERMAGRHGAALAAEMRRAASDAGAAHALARRAYEIGLDEDEARSWLWVAACLGSVPAAGEMGAVMMALGVSDRSGRAATWRRRGEEWFSLRDAQAFPAGAPADPIAVAEAIEAAAAVEAAAMPREVPDPAGFHLLGEPGEAPAAPGRVVVGAIGDAGSREGQDLARRFGLIVGRSLPYRGTMPAPGEIRREILARWPWARIAADLVEEALAVRRLSADRFVRLPNMLFVGPPGSGKTSLAEWLPVRLGLHRTTIPCGGASDAAGLTATTRSWSTARPCAMANAMQEGGTCNPVLVLDEIDKTTGTGSHNGSVSDALLQIVNAAEYQDQCLLAPLDISAVSYMATANALRQVGRTLAERFDVVPIPAPGPEHLPVIHANAVADFCRISGVARIDLPDLPEAALEYLGERFRKGSRSTRAYYLALQQVMAREIALRERGAASAAEDDERRRKALAAFGESVPRGPVH